ncbi:espin-like [Aphis craccivora]|uniref:Espin-like n=1 Tax=Aphis craccivora TaxID=307492 RepID=A0A6G0ZKJ2_APHCR|nr:espin-like [Aphis craccivora]
MAATNGHLNILMYAHENGCPWNECITFWDTISGNLDFLIYARKALSSASNSTNSHFVFQERPGPIQS